MLVISAEPYQSSMTVLYQRLTVIVTDVLLYYAILQSVTQTQRAAAAVCEHVAVPARSSTSCFFVHTSPCSVHLFMQICADSHQLG